MGVDEAAYQRDDERTQRLMASTTWVSGCTSWYKAATGRVTNNWPTWTVRYWYETLRLRPTDLRVRGRDRSDGVKEPDGTTPTPAVGAAVDPGG